MKLLESNDDTVTLLLAREEFHLLRDTARTAMQSLETYLDRYKRAPEELQGASEEEIFEALSETNAYSLDELQDEIEQWERLLAQVRGQAEVLEQITTEGDMARLL
jgi:hypothetical protein